MSPMNLFVRWRRLISNLVNTAKQYLPTGVLDMPPSQIGAVPRVSREVKAVTAIQERTKQGVSKMAVDLFSHQVQGRRREKLIRSHSAQPTSLDSIPSAVSPLYHDLPYQSVPQLPRVSYDVRLWTCIVISFSCCNVVVTFDVRDS